MKSLIKWNKAQDCDGKTWSKVFFDNDTSIIFEPSETVQLINKIGDSSFEKYYENIKDLIEST